MFSARLFGALEALDALQDAVGDELPRGLWQIAQAVAAEAKASHLYQNRTGDLEASTEASEPAGSFYDDTLIASVDAFMPYASFLDDRPEFAFLLPAFERSTQSIESILNTSLERAIDRAGWSR